MQPPDRAAPFDSAQAAWFAVARTMNTNPIGTDRQVEGVVRCLDRLYRNRRIELLHARILRIWGRRGIAPNPARPNERSDWQIWREALERLDGPLRALGIVGELGAGSPGSFSAADPSRHPR